MSNETKWTPGPWHKAHRNNNDMQMSFHGAIIGDVFVETTTRNEEADAHLIAAAPDLYEALSMLVSSDAVAFYPSAIEQSDWGSVDFEEWGDRARAALAKARGES